MTIFTKKSLGTIFALLLFFFLVLVTVATAEEPKKYTPLVGIPGITNSGAKSIGEYLNAIYLLLISVGGLIGVVKISMAGVKYSMSDVVTDKGEAKKDIMGVLLGLAILLIPAVVLNTIYSGPDGKSGLTNLNVLDNAPKVKLEPSRGGAGGGAGTTTQSFIQGLPKPPFDSNGNCQGTFIPDTTGSEVGSGGHCDVDCRAECTSRGGTPTQYSNQSGVQCLKIRCSK